MFELLKILDAAETAKRLLPTPANVAAWKAAHDAVVRAISYKVSN